MDKFITDEESKVRLCRLKKAMERFGIVQHDFTAEKGFNKSTVSQWINGKRNITPESMQNIKRELLPEVSLDYLLGNSDYMTIADQINEARVKSAYEASLLNPAVINLLRLSGYTVQTYWEDGIPQRGQVEEVIEKIKNYCTISKDGRTKVLDIGQFNTFANLVCDYTDFVAQTIL